MAPEQSGDFLDILKAAEFARTNNFDLMGDDGWEMLQSELIADFPYLTLADVGSTIRLGIKGELDTFKNRPLNFTRVYQWVKQRAPYSAGYWRTKHPELLRWAEMCLVLDTLLPKLYALYEKHGPTVSIEFAVVEHVKEVNYPCRHAGVACPDPTSQHAETTNYQHIKDVLWPTFAAEYPDYAAKHPNLF